MRLDEFRSGITGELQGEMTGMKTELRGEMAGMKAELRGEMTGMKAELRSDMADLRTDLRGEIRENTAKILQGVDRIVTRFDAAEKDRAAHAMLHKRIGDDLHHHDQRIKKLEARV